MNHDEAAKAPSFAPAVSVEGPSGSVRLKWHKLRTRLDEAPFKLSNLALGWKLGASLEVDIIAAADGQFVVLHDATLGPSTTGCGRVTKLSSTEMTGLFHRDGNGVADRDAPVLLLTELFAHLKAAPRTPNASLQLDLKIIPGHPLTRQLVAHTAEHAFGLGKALIIGSHYLDEARRFAAEIPGARLGYDPMLAASRDQDLLRNPERLLRHMERRSKGVTLAYLRYDAVIAAEEKRFRLVRRLLDLGIETDAWTVNPGRKTTDATLASLLDAGVRQITTDAPSLLARQIESLGPAAAEVG